MRIRSLILIASPEVPDTTLIKHQEVSIMINQSTIDKLIEMRLTAMADAFRIQSNDISIKDVPFED
jgi:hypothetical protein